MTHRALDVELTAAFYNPKVLSHVRDFVKVNSRFAVGHVGETLGKEALLIGLQMNSTGLLALLLANVLVCIGTGTVVGLLTNRVDLGVSVTSSVAAVVACVQAVLFLVK